ncbi:MAG: DUF1028 domain-containing protein [Acidimicrobiia bacterium]
MTFSVVAFDDATGALGIAVASHSVAVGGRVPHVSGGVGAIATQALTDTTYGTRLLEGLAARRDPGDVLQSIASADGGAEHRQVAVIDGKGRSAGISGRRCLPFSAQQMSRHASAQGNLLASLAVVPAMIDAFHNALVSPNRNSMGGDLVHRLMSSLEAGDRAGGDVRGARSAAVMVAWPDGARLDARIDDDANPVARLGPLLNRSLDQHVVGAAQRAALLGSTAADASTLELALAAVPGRTQLEERRLWRAVLLFRCGKVDAANQLLGHGLRTAWPMVIDRLVEDGLLPRDASPDSAPAGTDDDAPTPAPRKRARR